MQLKIKDRPGAMKVEEMRNLFERAVTETPKLRGNTTLGTFVVNGEFLHYSDPDTDTMWIGFALGLRTAERLLKANTKGSRAWERE